MNKPVFAAAALLALAPLTHAAPALARQMTADDLATLPRLAAPTTSPDGRWVVYQQTDTNPDSYARTTGLWIVPADGTAAAVRVADLDGANEHDAAFSRDGRRLYFLSNKSGKEQLWFAPALADGTWGAPVQASDTLADVAGYRLSPDGNNVLMWGDIAAGCATFGCEGNGDRATAGPGSGRVYDEMFVRHWDSWETPGVYSRAFTFALSADGQISGQPVAIGGELTGDTPVKPFGGGEELAWSADSRTIYFTMRIANANEPRSTNLDIYAAPAAGGEAVNLTPINEATDTLPTPSPDGRWLAYVAMARPGYEADRQVVMLLDLRNGSRRALTQDWDRSVDSLAWTPDSRSLLVTAQDTLQHPMFRVDVRNGRVQRLTERGSVNSVSPLPGGSIIYAINSLTSPNVLVRMDSNGQTRQLANPAGERMASIDPVRYELFNFPGANGDTVWGQIITPANARPGMPTVLLVHGGPQGSFGNGWSTRWNPMLFASGGFAVVTIDFHGSSGYGQAFTDSINRDWGGKPLEDLRLGMVAAAAASPAVNPANACAAGGSYGGYMMNWIAGNWPDGFRCLITHAGVFDLRAMAFETEELWFDEWDHGGPWWERTDPERWNPVNHVTNWRTPTLVIHGEKDFRIPYSQSLAAFTALQRQGIASRLLIYPDENHWILRGRNSVQWYREVFAWMRQYTSPDRSLDIMAASPATPSGQ